ncbi:hypothetical protein ACED63_13520 [Vibrio splendidus]|uniref:hypothetical protein n=1 Tax=Vibrio splendidus TaxID=29497 RepID=UPI00352FD6D4
MLVKENVELESGVTIKKAFYVIGDIAMNKSGHVSFRVDVHADIEKPALDCFYDAFQYQGGDIHQEANDKLKLNGGYSDYVTPEQA